MEGVILDVEDIEVDNTWHNQISGRNCVLFLIDVRKRMFVESDGTCYFKESMLCCRNAMLDIARKQKSDMIGVMLFGTKISEGKYAPDNVAVLQELVVPSVPVIKNIDSIIENDFVQLREKFGDVDEADLTRAINYCQIMLHICKKKLYLKNIVMMTYDDNPCGQDEKAAFRARKQANELYLHEIELDIVTLDTEFDSSKLFKELILTSRGELLRDWEGKDPIMKIEDVKDQIEKLTQKYSRRLSFLRIGSNKSLLLLQTCLYKLFTEPKKILRPVRHSETSNENKNKENGNTAENMEIDEADDILRQEDVLSQIADDEKAAMSRLENVEKEKSEFSEVPAQEAKPPTTDVSPTTEEREDNELHPLIGGRFIDITKLELKKRTLASNLNIRRGFQLIGFVQTVEVPLYYNIGEGYFMLPYGRNKHNRSAFSYLFHKCVERQVSMFGWFCLTKSAKPVLTFLHPLRASQEGKGHPNGFLLCKVPFSDEIFEVDENESIVSKEANEEQLQAAKQIVNRLTIPYEVNVFNDNEYLGWIAMIEALAMDYSNCPQQEDSTYVDLEEVEERLGELNILFKGSDDISENNGTSGKAMKRAATGTSGGGQNRAKQRKPADVIGMIQRGEANKLTVAELRDILKAEGVKSLSTLTKGRLVDIATRRFSSDSQ